MKRALPESSKIAKETKGGQIVMIGDLTERLTRLLEPHRRRPECIQEATSEFISFITSEAADRATSEKRKTITGDDILYALKTLGFDEMSEVLLIYLAKYREVRSSAWPG